MTAPRLSVEILSANSIELVARVRHRDAACLPTDGKLVCARRDDRIVMVAAVGRPAGRVIDVLLPERSERLDEEEGAAVLQAIDDLIKQNSEIYLAQVLLGAHSRSWNPLLLAFDFLPITTVELFAAVPDVADIDSALVFSTVSQCSAFADLLRATWQGSLDCRDLKDERTSDDVLTEYLARCGRDATHWYQIEFQGRAIGCAILAAPTDPRVIHPLETLYWGILPEYRGRGFGDETLQFLRGVAAREGRMLAAAVDQKNLPAKSVYLRNGFQIEFSKL